MEEPSPTPAESALAAPDAPIGDGVFLALLLLVPLAIVLERAQAPGAAVFGAAVLGFVPLSRFIGRATEEISLLAGPATAAILNATFGNAVELIIAARLLNGASAAGPRLVKASIVGSLVTNLLLLVGLSMLAGGFKYKEQRFNPVAAGVSASLLLVAFAGVSLPAIYGQFVDPARVLALSRAVCVVMALVYVAGLVFTFVTHRHLFDTTDELRDVRKPEWSPRRAVAVLAASILAVAWMAGVLERTIEHAGPDLGLSPTFIGVIVLGLLTNVAENLSAIAYARRDKIDLSIQIGTSSANQIMLFVVPLLVLIGALGGRPFALDFSGFELACMFLPVLITNHLATDGQCNWLEGLELIGLYALIGVAFFFVP